MFIKDAITVIKNASSGAGGVVEKFSQGIGDIKKIKEGDVSARDAAVQSSYQAEYNHGGGWFNALVDGINRLVRPLITYGVCSFFILAVVKPSLIISASQALKIMPDEAWWLFGTVIVFWFGGRYFEKRKK